MIKRNRFLLLLLLLLVILSVTGLKTFYSQNRSQPATREQTQTGNTTQKDHEKGIPEKVYQVLRYVETHQKPMEGYAGGREFMNREKRLPLQSAQNKTMKYREWDVNPGIKGRNRGTERLITGNDRSAWYTADHYSTFIKIK